MKKKIILRIALFLLATTVFGLVIFFVEPPKSWEEASIPKMLIFFVAFLAVLNSFINIFVNYVPTSFILSLAIMLLVVLKTVNTLSLLTIFSIFFPTAVLVLVFKEPRRREKYIRSGLTNNIKIPKLTRIGGKR